MRALLIILAASAWLSGMDVSAQGLSIVQGSDGTSGTIVDLGGGFRSYSDSHGNRGTIMDLGGGLQTYQFSSPQGGLRSGTILTLPAPHSNAGTAPSGMTPAPVLPFIPKGPLMPREQVAPIVPLTQVMPSTGAFNGFGESGRRSGR